MSRISPLLTIKLSLGLCLLAGLGLPLVSRADPTAEQQYYLELLNQARMDPAGELGRLVNYDTPTTFADPASNDADVAAALAYFGVSAADLASQWATLAAAPPLAWNDNLATAATTYSNVMIAQDQQAHNLDGLTLDQRDINAGYGSNYLDLGENLYAAAASVNYANAGFLIDWGPTADGIQTGAAHRQTSFDPAFKEIGIGLVTTGIPAGNVNAIGPYVVTQELGNQFRIVGGNYISDAILTGVLYVDNVIRDNFYTPGEGLAGQPILVFDKATHNLLFSGTTNTAGGFNIDLQGVTAGEQLLISAPGSGLPDQTDTVTSYTTDASVYGAPVTFFPNIYAGFEEVPEPGSAVLIVAGGLILACGRRRFCFDKQQ